MNWRAQLFSLHWLCVQKAAHHIMPQIIKCQEGLQDNYASAKLPSLSMLLSLVSPVNNGETLMFNDQTPSTTCAAMQYAGVQTLRRDWEPDYLYLLLSQHERTYEQ